MTELAAAAIPADFEDLFRGDALAQVATLRPDGTPHLTPIWIDLDGDRVLVDARADRLKALHMQQRPDVTICVVDAANPYRYVSVTGSWRGKKALVTGGGRGIGRAIALAFARQGAEVALAARSHDQLEAVADEVRELGHQAHVLPTDMPDVDAARAMVAEAAAMYLCSDEAEWVSGNVLYVTGGQLATSDVFRWVRARNPVPDGSKI